MEKGGLGNISEDNVLVCKCDHVRSPEPTILIMSETETGEPLEAHNPPTSEQQRSFLKVEGEE